MSGSYQSDGTRALSQANEALSNSTVPLDPPPDGASTADGLPQPGNPAVARQHEIGEPALPERLGRFVVKRELGRGAFGCVYLAHDGQLDRLVAIKVPVRQGLSDPKRVQAFAAEARVLASLKHPNIVTVYEIGMTESNLPFVVSELIEGSDLAKMLTANRLSVVQSAELVAAIADALHYAHQKGVFHRDVKPGNILLESSGKPYLADFGLALLERDFGAGPRFAGTPGYMSPEQAAQQSDQVDGRSDIFSLGVVLYELLTRRLPFQGRDVPEFVARILSPVEARPPRQIDDSLPPDIDRICLKAISKRITQRYSAAKDFADELREFVSEGRRSSSESRRMSGDSSGKFNSNLPPAPRLVELPRFGVARTFKGREEELRRLDQAWADPNTNVLILRAWAGVGKSMLVASWLGRMAKENYRGAEAVFGYCFEGTGGDRFMEHALRSFNDPDPTQGSPEEKGARLAELIGESCNLLVLDGFESVQEHHGEVGKIRSTSLEALVRGLTSKNRGLCIITTRLPIIDLNHLSETTAPTHELGNLSPQCGASILQALGVEGPNEELEQAAIEARGHAMTLNFLGSYLTEACHGDIFQRDQFRILEEDDQQGGQAKRILGSYELHLQSQQLPALEALRVVCLFSRPAQPDALAAVLASPVIKGLTDNVVNSRPTEWNRHVRHLRDHGLLVPAPTDGDRRIIAAPLLVREFISDNLRRDNPLAFQEGHRRLYNFFRRTKPELPQTTDQMAPLYLAVMHGCLAGLHGEVLEKLYWPRIKRGEARFNTKVLNAFLGDLNALGGFFESRWDKLDQRVPMHQRAQLFYEVAFDLRALGRMDEALTPMRHALVAYARAAQPNWVKTAAVAGDLCLLYATLGRLDAALRQAKLSVRYAERSGSAFERVRARSNLVLALTHVGRLAEARATFEAAEEICRQFDAARDSGHAPTKPTLRSFWFFELFLALKDYAKVESLTRHDPVAFSSTGMPHLETALLELVQARVCLAKASSANQDDDGIASPDDREKLFDEAAARLEVASSEMKLAHTTHHFPRVMLTQAALHRLRGEFQRAADELDLARGIAVRGGMELYKIDILLESARLHVASGDVPAGVAETEQAKDRVEQTGYHRRSAEVSELEQSIRASQ